MGVPTPPKYKPGNIDTSAYVQINVGVPLTKVTNLYGESARSGNEFHKYETTAVGVAKKVFKGIKSNGFCEDGDEERVVGFFTLLGAAILGAQAISTETLLKKLWSVLPKCGLHEWWKLERTQLSQKLQKNLRDPQVFTFIRDDLFCDLLKVEYTAPLLGQYSDKWLRELAEASKLPIFNLLANYKVQQYASDVMTGKRDLLVEVALQHRTTTGQGTSQLALDTDGGQPLGVMEVRNIYGRWDIGQWRQQAEQWAKFAYQLTGRNWDQDLLRERAEQQRQLQVAMQSYEESLNYRRHMSQFVPEF
jgi:hypothetical protein